MSKPNEHPEPYSPSYGFYYSANNDGFGGFGLRLTNIITSSIPQNQEAERFNDLKAISQILLNYEQWLILDTYGAAPITEAFREQGEGIRTPRYDLYQQSIDGSTPMYKKIDAEVKAAIELLKASNENQYAIGNSDFFYFGDVRKWIKFGNTLRVKMAQRLEKADVVSTKVSFPKSCHPATISFPIRENLVSIIIRMTITTIRTIFRILPVVMWHRPHL